MSLFILMSRSAIENTARMHFWFFCDETESRPKLGQRLHKDVYDGFGALRRHVKLKACYLCSHCTDTGVLLGGMCRSLIKRILSWSCELKMSQWIMSDCSRKDQMMLLSSLNYTVLRYLHYIHHLNQTCNSTKHSHRQKYAKTPSGDQFNTQ